MADGFKFFEAALVLMATRNSILAGSRQSSDDKKRPIENGATLLSDVTSEGAVIGAGLTQPSMTVTYKIEREGKLVEESRVIECGDTLVITGSRNVKDYLYYNLRPNRSLPNLPELEGLTKDFPERAYQKGFLLHAARVQRFLRGRKPKFIIGHSLGAASAQILGTALGVPTICFASPQVIRRRYLEPDPVRKTSHAQWNVFNVAWNKDFVTRGYRLTGLRSLGYRIVLKNSKFNLGIDHFVKQYATLIYMDSKRAEQRIPKMWRDHSYVPPAKVAPGWF